MSVYHFESSKTKGSISMDERSICRSMQTLIDKACDDSLTETEKEELERHVACCEDCRTYQKQLQALKQALKDCSAEAPASLCESVMSKIGQMPREKQNHRRFVPAVAGAAVAALIAVGLIGSPIIIATIGNKSSAPSSVEGTATYSLTQSLPEKALEADSSEKSQEIKATYRVTNLSGVTLQIEADIAALYRDHTLLFTGTVRQEEGILVFKAETTNAVKGEKTGTFVRIDGDLCYKEGNLFE